MSGDVRYGIIGLGMMGLEHVRNLLALRGARVDALADPRLPSLEAGAALLAGRDVQVATYADHRDLLAAALVDAVVIATPNHTHTDILLDALAADVHVLVEKPLCTTVEDCRRVVAAAAGHRRVIWVGLEYRFMPPVAALLAEIDGGTVGRVRMVAIREHRFPFLPKVGDWNRFNRNTGGTLVEKCCHFFDLMNRITGTVPTRVMASGAQDVNHLDECYDGEVPDVLDNAFVIVDYADGARAMLDLCMFAEATTNMEEVSVVGDAGKVEAFLPSSILRVGRRADGWFRTTERVVHDPSVAYEGFHHGSSYLEHVAFLDAIRAGRPAGVGLAEGLVATAMGVAAHRSIDEGRPVTMAEVLG